MGKHPRVDDVHQRVPNENIPKSLPENHPIHHCNMFEDINLVEALKAEVVCGLKSERLRATGVPPHVATMHEMGILKEEFEKQS